MLNPQTMRQGKFCIGKHKMKCCICLLGYSYVRNNTMKYLYVYTLRIISVQNLYGRERWILSLSTV